MSRVEEVLIVLKQEMDNLRQAIHQLELLEAMRNGRTAKVSELNGVYVTKSTRGRKFMGPEERLQVSARMKAYWASMRR